MSKEQFNQYSADLVLKNGKLLTMDADRPQVETLAVRDNKIIALGSDGEIEPYMSSHTRVIDLEGQLAVPGFIEGHGHYMSLGESLMGLDLRPNRSWEEIVNVVADAVRTAKPGAWIVGRGWHQDKWDDLPSPNIDGFPVHHRLNEMSPNNPVILIHASGHGVFVNALALEQSAIYPDTSNPTGGEIVRDSHGNPTGMLRETAQNPAREALAKSRAKRPAEVIESELRQQVKLAAEEALANGITSFHDMGETFRTIDLYRKMADEGNLPLRLYVCVQEPSEVMRDQLADYRMVGYGNNYLTVRAIGEKVLDGALGVHGGWLLEPYADMPQSSGFNVETYTVNNAYAAFEENVKGTLTPGKLADITIFSQDIMSIPEEEILNTKIAYTIIGGEVKYQGT